VNLKITLRLFGFFWGGFLAGGANYTATRQAAAVVAYCRPKKAAISIISDNC
jgi:hypothetical protein